MRRKETMPDFVFRLMAFSFKIMDLFSSPVSILDNLEIKAGDTVIDYGCGPGRYIKKASQLVGKDGVVHGVDLHHLAVATVLKLVRKENLNNVNAVQAYDYSVALPDQVADIIYAFDMFHMVEEPGKFLQELYRLLKHEGYLYLEPGHQSYALAKEKILTSGLWIILVETRYFKCTPKTVT